MGEPELLSILMPVYNERAYLRRCVELVLAAPLPAGVESELLIVDDASTDGTRDLVVELAGKYPERIRSFFQERNQGKGAAVRRAIREMRGHYGLIQDADLEYDPDDYRLLLRPILEGRADVVYGSRFAPRAMRRVLNYHHSLGNKFLTHLSNAFTGLNLTDMETCYKVFRADVLKTIPLRSNRFGMEPEITAKIAKRGCVVYEVPISYYGRASNEGKKIGWRDGVSALYTILKFWILDDCYEEYYGHSVLANLTEAHRFGRWTVELLEPYLGDRVVEVGAGIGNISRFLPKNRRLTVTDINSEYLGILHDTYRHNELVDVARFDVAEDNGMEEVREGVYDTVICLNVLEHIEDDEKALRRMRRLLAPGGRLLLVVPQHPGLYGSYDRRLGHHRRYTLEQVKHRLAEAGYRFVESKSFNALSILPWWLNACLLKRSSMGRVQIKIFDSLVPVQKRLEAILPHPGLSLLCVAEAPR